MTDRTSLSARGNLTRAHKPHSNASRHRSWSRSLSGAALMLAAAGVCAQDETPQYGGTLTTSTVNPTITALTWDNADWNWKFNQDTGQVYEQLFVADLSKSKRLGGPHAFTIDAWIPDDAITGELAESWELKQDPLRVEIKLRKGVMFPEKTGVMKSRELVADDIVYAFNRYNNSPKKIPNAHEHIERVEAVDKHTVIFHFRRYVADWQYQFGYGYYSAIVPKEVGDAGAANWRNHNGTGPYMLTEFTQGGPYAYEKNPLYWGKTTIGGREYKLPFTDKVIYRTIKDTSTLLAAFRTGKVDLLEALRWTAAEELKKTSPQVKFSRWLNPRGTYMVLRNDRKPFDDIRVRRALNMAINKQEIISSFYNGNAEILGYPEHPDYGGYYEPLDKMPDSVKELYTYNPEKAKKLLAEAGYPKGFTFKVQFCSCNPTHVDLLPLIVAYLEQVNVKVDLVPMEYGAYLSAMTTKTHEAGYFMDNGHTGPVASLRKSFQTGHLWNASMYSNPEYDKKIERATIEPDAASREALVREMTREIIDQAPYIWLPTQYLYSAWWPWVKNYGGELRAGADRPGPIYARIWIDQALKKKMGF